jgi:hypothetical protein
MEAGTRHSSTSPSFHVTNNHANLTGTAASFEHNALMIRNLLGVNGLELEKAKKAAAPPPYCARGRPPQFPFRDVLCIIFGQFPRPKTRLNSQF